MLNARDICFAYRSGANVLEGVSLDVRRGTITGVVGPNGSGKTTLIKILAGIIPPACGNVEIEHVPLRDMSPRERARLIAYVPQETHIPFSFTALEVVLMGRAPHCSAFSFEDESDIVCAHRAMAATDTAPLAGRGIDELSGGERQRVILARALAQRPRLMLLDEPVSSLDIRHQMAFCRLLARQCADEDLTVVASMHDLNIAAACCDEIVMLRDGHIAAAGPPAEVFCQEVLGRVFDASVEVGWSPTTGLPYVIPSIPKSR